MFRASLAMSMRHIGLFRPSAAALQAILAPSVRKGAADSQRAVLDPSLRVITPPTVDVLNKRLPAVGHQIIWEYYVQLAATLARIEELQSVVAADGTSPLSTHRNKDATPFDLVKWNTRYSWEVDFACAIAKHVRLIEDAHTAQQQAAASGAPADEVAMLKEMAGEDIDAAVAALEAELPAMEAAVRRRVDESDEWSKAATVWTFETIGRAGGEEAGIFARDMLEFYKKAFEGRNWKVEDISDPEAHGGRLRIEGDDVYPYLKHEMGTHRVQRVPVTDSAGKMQTSTCSVMLMPQPSAVSVNINENDCKFDFVRGSGPGGQGMQSSSNCCVMTHIPSGFSCKVHQARSAAGNKALALEMLAQKLWREKNAANESYQNSLFEKQWTSGERGEKIRTYNFPQNRVTEHRLPADVPLTAFMEGGEAFRAIQDRLVEADRRDQLTNVYVKHIKGGFSSN